MNLTRYNIVKIPVGGLAFASFIEVLVCTECGNIVGDAGIHDKSHDRINGIAQTANQASSKAYDYTPYGR